MLLTSQFFTFLVFSLIKFKDFSISFQQKNETKKTNTLMQFKYFLFCLSIDLFEVKDLYRFQKKSNRW